MEVPDILNFKIIVVGHQGSHNDKQASENPPLSHATSRASFWKTTMSPWASSMPPRSFTPSLASKFDCKSGTQ